MARSGPVTTCSRNSLVALDCKTGAFKWHYQSIRHDVWDMDNTHAPLLADVHDRRPAAQGRCTTAASRGITFVLDRTNGKPLLGVERRSR